MSHIMVNGVLFVTSLNFLLFPSHPQVTVEYFQLYHTVMSPIPLQYQTLSESSQIYEAGKSYAEYVVRQHLGSRDVQPEVYVFEPYVHGQKYDNIFH